ncbi:low molecular weight phosphatase family protein [Minwuia sp.]|uniref:arsenate-mycothiol transferase ArsC n=1 Tax=Minwuia sp. TaxID=2493630 RepID=UPI003A90D36A
MELPGAVLFTCTENSVRSPMAEGLLKQLMGHAIYVDSCGVRSRDVDGFSIAAMDELGIDISGHRAKSFDDLEDTFFDVIISLSPESQHKAIELTRTMACDVEYWPTLDPSLIEGSREARLDAWRQVRDSLRKRILERFSTGPAPTV